MAAAAEEAKEATSAPAVEPLKYQTWVLKVSIHCEGCKRKVKKVLQSVDGVYEVSVDLKQHKVTVTGNVDGDTLIRKLHKAGRHAEPWPEKPKKEKENKENTPNSNKDGKDPKGSGKPKEDSGAGEACETKHAEETKSTAKNAGASPKAAANTSAEKAAAPRGGGKESPKGSDGKDGGTSPPQEKPAAGGGATDGEKASGGGGKKGKKGGGEASEISSDAMTYPHVLLYHHPHPVYTVSYNMAYPSASYGTAYHTAAHLTSPQQSRVSTAQQRQQQQHYHYTGYSYQPPAGVFIPPSDEEGSYDVFSDENANACCVM